MRTLLICIFASSRHCLCIVGAHILSLLLLITKPCRRRSWSTSIHTTSKPILNRMKLVLKSDKKKASQWTREPRTSLSHTQLKGNWYSNQSRSSHSPDVMMKTESGDQLWKINSAETKSKAHERRSHITQWILSLSFSAYEWERERERPS